MRLAKAIGEALVTLIAFIAILLVGFMVVGPRFGWETHVVLSGSMEPVLQTGGLIVTRPEKVENLAVGDIITFQSGKQTVTHRIADIIDKDGKRWFQTKGDANESSDPNLVSSNTGLMRKVVLHVPYVGFIASFANSRFAFLALAGIPALILVILLIGEIRKGIREEREKRQAKRDSFGQQGVG
mgnify:CR=1 FL=1